MSAQPVDVLAVALFEAYARNGGNNPNEHFDRNAAEQWMAQALGECGVAGLIEENARLREIASAFLPVMEAARPLVLNLERLRDAARCGGTP